MSSKNMMFFGEDDLKTDELTLAEAFKIDKQNQMTTAEYTFKKKTGKKSKVHGMSLAEAFKIDLENQKTEAAVQIDTQRIYDDSVTEMSLSQAANILMSLNTLSSLEFSLSY